VDYDYIVETARLASQHRIASFHLVSSVGADASSMFLYPRTKGEAEATISGIHFDALNIYRPSTLIGEREQTRWMETLSRPLTYLLGSTYRAIDVKDVAKVMVMVEDGRAAATHNGVRILENSELHRLAAEAPTAQL
jgi:uncharacterized protein YbjT (DUF2867 family)